MPKMKSLRAACKRFKRTGTGKIKRNKAFATHILKKKSTKRKRNFRRSAVLKHADERNISRLIS